MVNFVQKQPDLAVDVARSQVLRSGAEQDYLMVSPFEVVTQSQCTVHFVAEVVRLVHQYRPPVTVLLGQIDAVVAAGDFLVLLGFAVKHQVRWRCDAALRQYLSAQAVELVEPSPGFDQSSWTDDQRRPVVGVALPQLAQ